MPTTREQVTELLDKMQEQRARLIEQVRGVSEAEAERVPQNKTGEEQWTVKEQLAHLCEMELSYDTWVQAALNAENPSLAGMKSPVAEIPVEAANASPVAALLKVMSSERQDTLTMIEQLSVGDFDRTATHPNFGTLSVMQWLRSFYRHDRMHADQIAGREPEYRPKFTGAEPDQRTPRLQGRRARS